MFIIFVVVVAYSADSVYIGVFLTFSFAISFVVFCMYCVYCTVIALADVVSSLSFA